ncbi:MAG: helix-turn-helix domain-containing protein [Candidatus Hodarchaeota archaeon]
MAQFKESLVINRVYKYELRLNNHERSLLRRCEGLSRFTWNWALAERLKGFNTQKGKQKFTTAIAQHRDLNKLKQTEFMWMYKYAFRRKVCGIWSEECRIFSETGHNARWGVPGGMWGSRASRRKAGAGRVSD